MSSATLNRRDILEGLETLLRTVTGITTVVRGYNEPDIKQYTEAQLPLLYIAEPAESEDKALTGRRQMMNLDPGIRVWFVCWSPEPSAAYEALVKNIRNKIGGNFTVAGTAVGCWVTGVSIVSGTMPLFDFSISLRTLYYLDMLDA